MIERLAGPSTHIAWTPDMVPKEKRETVVLVRLKDLERLELGQDRQLRTCANCNRPEHSCNESFGNAEACAAGFEPSSRSATLTGVERDDVTQALLHWKTPGPAAEKRVIGILFKMGKAKA